MKILIVGGGIGGLALAAFLETYKIEYDLIEKAPNWQQQGFSIGLWNNGRIMLKKLGLAQEFDRQATRIKHYIIANGAGKLLRQYDLDSFYNRYGTSYSHIDRQSLHELLLGKIDAARLGLSTTIKELTQTPDRVSVTLSNGKTKVYDLVVGCDGAKSVLRSFISPGTKTLCYEEWRAWYGWISNTLKTKATVSEYIEPSQFAAVFDDGAKTLLVLMAPASHGVWDDTAGRIARLKTIFKNEAAIIPQAFENLHDEQIMPFDLCSVETKRWFAGRIALLGDAAHALPPHAGLGGGMAMEDAYVLAGELSRIDKDYSLQAALARYESVRKPRVALARTLTNRMRGWAMIKSPLLRKILNSCIAVVPERFFIQPYQKLLDQEI